MSYVKDGDNYPKECTKTTKLIMDKLEIFVIIKPINRNLGHLNG